MDDALKRFIEDNYVTMKSNEAAFAEFDKKMMDTYVAAIDFKYSHEKLAKKVKDNKETGKALTKELQSQSTLVKEVRAKLSEKAEKRSVDKIKESLKAFCTYQDLKDLYKKIVPQMSTF